MEGEKSVRKSELPPFSGAKLHSHSRSHAERSEVGLTFAPKNGGNSDLKLKLKRRQLPFSRPLNSRLPEKYHENDLLLTRRKLEKKPNKRWPTICGHEINPWISAKNNGSYTAERSYSIYLLILKWGGRSLAHSPSLTALPDEVPVKKASRQRTRTPRNSFIILEVCFGFFLFLR